MRRRLAVGLAAASVALCAYFWFRYLTWHAATELRTVTWSPAPDLHGWTGPSRGGSEDGFRASAYRCEESPPPIVHDGYELAFCGDLGDYEDQAHTQGLWRFDYARGEARLVYPLHRRCDLFLPRSHEIAAIGAREDGFEIGLAGPTGWIDPPSKIAIGPQGTTTGYMVSGLVWISGALHALALPALAPDSLPDAEDQPEDVPLPPARDVVVEHGHVVAARDLELVGATAHRVGRIADAEWRIGHDLYSVPIFPLAEYRDDQWWVLVRRYAATLGMSWMGLPRGEPRDLDADWGAETSLDTEDLTSGVLARSTPRFRIEAGQIEGPVKRSSEYTSERLAWVGDSLRGAGPTKIDAWTDRLAVAGKQVDLHWRPGGRDGVEVWIGDPRNVVALIPRVDLTRSPEQTVRPGFALLSGADGRYYLSDGAGRYATLDASFHRIDDWDLWEYLRSGGSDDDRTTLPVMWPELWPVRLMAAALYGLPLGLLALLALARLQRPQIPAASVAPLRRGLVLASGWSLAVLMAYLTVATVALVRVLPLLAA
jgi:hypothetical protein